MFTEGLNNKTMFLSACTEVELKNVFRQLKNNSAPRPDELLKKDMLYIYEIIENKLLELVNKWRISSNIEISKNNTFA